MLFPCGEEQVSADSVAGVDVRYHAATIRVPGGELAYVEVT